ncbi:LysR family transcriptional regulator [Tatumella sp. UBA2305]|uniref:LysR family transcriptional regulator n=1 Tax=Tatumella sp. UBA2305 TaxID=1947647 RepID=UPI0025D5CCCC|nr:LysR family transcriptional regulator [Tatumella sp. UBA2305]
MDRIQLSQLVVFVTVAGTGSFRAAAAQLGIAPSAVSHAVSNLEGSLGIRLLARTTRSTRPTEEGYLLLSRVNGPLSDIGNALAEVPDLTGKPRGPLRLTMPSLAAEQLVAPRLPEFMVRFPQIELDIRTADGFEDIVQSGCDAGIRLGENLEADMIAIPLDRPRRSLIVASPAYFSDHPEPRHPRDLSKHNCIRRRFQSGRVYRWELTQNSQPFSIEVTGNLILPQQSLIRQAALDGIGLAFLFEESVAEDLRAGRLKSVMEAWCPEFNGFFLYYPSRRQMRPALRAFIDFFRYQHE